MISRQRGAHHLQAESSGIALPVATLSASPDELPGAARPRHAAVRERRSRRLLAGTDALAAAVAALVVFGAPGGAQMRWPMLLIVPFVVLAGKLNGLYDRDELVLNKTTLDDAPRLSALAMVVVLGTWQLSDALLRGTPSRTDDVQLGLLLFAGMLFGRYAARRIAERVTEPDRCMVIGGAGAVGRVARIIEDTRHTALVTSISFPEAHELLRADARSGAARELLTGHDVHRAIIEPEGAEHADIALEVVRGARAHGLRVSLLPSVFDVTGASVEPDEVGELTLLGIAPFGLSRSSQYVKRGFDLLVGSLTLVLATPLLLAAALAIRIDSPGPVVFRQPRVGRNGRRFWILKLRTMVRDAEQQRAGLAADDADGLFKLPHDPRVTRVGRALRRSSIDELPQLVNVLRGEMSLVGPRPLIPREDRQVGGWDRQRLSLTPGMTGPWQIGGPTRAPLEEMVKLDYRYVATWSLWRDIEILLRTLRHVALRRGV